MPAWFGVLVVVVLCLLALGVALGVLAIFWPWDEDGNPRRPGRHE